MGLDNFVTDPELPTACQLVAGTAVPNGSRVQLILHNGVQHIGAYKPAVDRGENRDLIYWESLIQHPAHTSHYHLLDLSLIVRFDKVKLAALALGELNIHVNSLRGPDDFIRVIGDKAALALPHDLCQPGHRHHTRVDEIPQYQPRPHTGQLLMIAHNEEPGGRGEGLEQPGTQLCVAHGILVGNQQVANQFILAQHLMGVSDGPVDGRRLDISQLLGPYRGLPSRGANVDGDAGEQLLCCCY